jgi:geranylgeranylglycerol-phosphate geranylgeranyltransferase
MKGEVRILRPVNSILAGCVVIIAAFIVLPVSEFIELWLSITLAAISAGIISGVGMAINDYVDIDTDTISHPDRPLPSGEITKEAVLKLSVALFLVSLILTAFVNPICLGIAVLAIVLEVGYAQYLHKSLLGKNIIVSFVVALTFIFGGAAVGHVWARELWILAILTFIANVAREIIKDVEDIAGDQQTTRKTFPMVFGIKWSNWYASLLLGLVIVLSPTPFLLGIVGIAYLPLCIVTDIILLYAILRISKPTLAQKNIRYAMMVALGAFFAGALI